MYEKNLQLSGAEELKEEQLEHISGGTEEDLNVSVWNDDFIERNRESNGNTRTGADHIREFHNGITEYSRRE